MLEIQRNDGSWVKLHIPEWNTYSAEKQAEIIRNLKKSAENIIPFNKDWRAAREDFEADWDGFDHNTTK